MPKRALESFPPDMPDHIRDKYVDRLLGPYDKDEEYPAMRMPALGRREMTDYQRTRPIIDGMVVTSTLYYLYRDGNEGASNLEARRRQSEEITYDASMENIGVEMQDAETARMIERMNLPDDVRDIVERRAFQRQTYREIEKETGLSRGTIERKWNLFERQFLRYVFLQRQNGEESCYGLAEVMLAEMRRNVPPARPKPGQPRKQARGCVCGCTQFHKSHSQIVSIDKGRAFRTFFWKCDRCGQEYTPDEYRTIRRRLERAGVHSSASHGT